MKTAPLTHPLKFEASPTAEPEQLSPVVVVIVI